MANLAQYDVLAHYRDIHATVLRLAESLDEEQLRWKPQSYNTSIGFHLWHLARESDYLKATILELFELGSDFGETGQIWHAEQLAHKWGFPPDLGAGEVGTGISDEAAANLPLPPKAELLDYLRRSYSALEQFVELFDSRYASLDSVPEDMAASVERIRKNLMIYLLHDGRHLGMMECLKGLLTGFGSATEKRP